MSQSDPPTLRFVASPSSLRSSQPVEQMLRSATLACFRHRSRREQAQRTMLVRFSTYVTWNGCPRESPILAEYLFASDAPRPVPSITSVEHPVDVIPIQASIVQLLPGRLHVIRVHDAWKPCCQDLKPRFLVSGFLPLDHFHDAHVSFCSRSCRWEYVVIPVVNDCVDVDPSTFIASENTSSAIADFVEGLCTGCEIAGLLDLS